jgi:hypothetical protein
LDPLIKSQLLYQLSYAPCALPRAGRVLYQSDAVLSSKSPSKGHTASVDLNPAQGELELFAEHRRPPRGRLPCVAHFQSIPP